MDGCGATRGIGICQWVEARLKRVPPLRIPLSEPNVGELERSYLNQCVRSGWVSSSGPFVAEFEQKMATHIGAKHAVAVVNGTSALHLALLAAGIKENDEVLVPSMTFVATANAVRYVGAWPVFVDAEPAHWQMDPKRVEEFLDKQCHWRGGALFNKKSGRPVKALLPVHLLGHPCAMRELQILARHFRLWVIEDAAESVGASCHGRSVGVWGDLACLSFNGNKTMTSGGGGMVLTRKTSLAKRVRYLSTQAKDEGREYIHKAVGYNYRLSNLHAALGLAQLKRLPAFLRVKRQIDQRYRNEFRDLPGIEMMRIAPGAISACWLSTILVDEGKTGISSRELHNKLLEEGIQTRPLWQPMHLSPAHRLSQVLGGTIAERLWRQGLSLPSSTALTLQDQSIVVASIRRWTLAGARSKRPLTRPMRRSR